MPVSVLSPHRKQALLPPDWSLQAELKTTPVVVSF